VTRTADPDRIRVASRGRRFLKHPSYATTLIIDVAICRAERAELCIAAKIDGQCPNWVDAVEKVADDLREPFDLPF
jgi:hypothetical protein